MKYLIKVISMKFRFSSNFSFASITFIAVAPACDSDCLFL